MIDGEPSDPPLGPRRSSIRDRGNTRDRFGRSGLDAELIRLCNRLIVNRAREEAAFETIPDEDERACVVDPLHAEWFQLEKALVDFKLTNHLLREKAAMLWFSR